VNGLTRFPGAARLAALPTIGDGHADDLKMEVWTGDGPVDAVRVWLARGGTGDGYPYPRTASVEVREGGSWRLLGDYDAEAPPTVLAGFTTADLRIARAGRSVDAVSGTGV
jgi:hypothetical protein